MAEVSREDWTAWWAGLEANPGDAARQLAFADWLAEREHMPSVEFALRWMALFGRRPVFRPDVKRRPWQWMFEGSRSDVVRRIKRNAAYSVLPRWLVDTSPRLAGSSGWSESESLRVAVLFLADLLQPIREGLGLKGHMPPVPDGGEQ